MVFRSTQPRLGKADGVLPKQSSIHQPCAGALNGRGAHLQKVHSYGNKLTPIRQGSSERKLQPQKLNSASFFQLLPFTSKRFHVLLNSLFKVLCNFPSRYLFAIGLVVIFSLTWGLPRIWTALSSNPTLRRHKPTKVRSYMGLAPS